jgi:Lipocalin-like domain
MPNAQQFIGRWRLVSWSAVDDEGRVEHPVGDRPQGFAVLMPDGWAAVQVAFTNRPAMAGPDPFTADEAEQARAYATYLAYVSRYEVREDVLVLDVEMSLWPNQLGTQQVRRYRFEDGELLLQLPPVESGGRRLTHELRWRRDG